MSIDMKKKALENDRQYIWRICSAKKAQEINIEWADLADIINKETKEPNQYLSAYEYKNIFKIIDEYYADVFCEEIENDDLSIKLDEKIMNLNKTRIKLSTEKTEYMRHIREDTRDEMFSDEVIRAIKANYKKTPPPTPIVLTKEEENRSGLACFADSHFGKEFKIFGLNDEVINEYSPEIFYDRMNVYLGEIIRIAKKENLKKITIFNLGDHVEGFIRHSQMWTLRWGVIDSAINFGYFISDWLRRLSEELVVEYCQTDGNHDELRLLDGKKKQHLTDSSGKIITAMIKISNEDNKNLRLRENKTGFAFTELQGYNILGIHGEVKSLADAISKFTNIYNTPISYLLGGHKHHTNYVNTGVRKGCLGVGSIVGSDEYSMSIMTAADPTASFFVFEEGKGKTVDYTVVLD